MQSVILSSTTSNASFLSDKIKIFLFLSIASNAIAVIVWDFPVPGGPEQTINLLFGFFIAD